MFATFLIVAIALFAAICIGAALELCCGLGKPNASDIALLQRAVVLDWAAIDPSIFTRTTAFAVALRQWPGSARLRPRRDCVCVAGGLLPDYPAACGDRAGMAVAARHDGWPMGDRRMAGRCAAAEWPCCR